MDPLTCDGPGQPDGPVCGCARCERLPAPGWAVCSPHGRALGDHLAELATLWDRLDAAPSLAGREPGTGHGGTLPSQRAPGSLEVMAMRDRRSSPRDPADADDGEFGNGTPPVLATLVSWAATVRAEQKIPLHRVVFAPLLDGWPGPICDQTCGHESCGWRRPVVFRARPTFASERRLLADQLPWILEQDWAGELADEVRAGWAACKTATGQPAPRRRSACRMLIDGERCGGTVTWADGKACCDRCMGVWSGLDAARLGAGGEEAA